MHTEKEPVDLDVLSEMGYEKRDVDLRRIRWWIIIFFAIGLFFFVTGYAFFVWLAPKQVAMARSGVDPVTKRVPPQPNPLLQNNIETKFDIQKMRQEEVELLTTYGYVDRERGIVRMPIERAKELLLQRGANQTPVAPPVRPNNTEPPTGDDLSPRNRQGLGAADKAPGAASAGDTAPRTRIPTSRPGLDPNLNGGRKPATNPGAGRTDAGNPNGGTPGAGPGAGDVKAPTTEGGSGAPSAPRTSN